MESKLPNSTSSSCFSSLFACTGKATQSQSNASTPRIGFERDVNVTQQPHLITPMKLTFWVNPNTIPQTHLQSQLPQWVLQGKILASRASSSLVSYIRPQPIQVQTHEPLPQPAFHREDIFDFSYRRTYRPLELDIYKSNNSQSLIPDFDQLSFTKSGEIRRPTAVCQFQTRGCTNITSDLPFRSQTSVTTQEGQRPVHARQNTASTVITTSQSMSEYSAVVSRPVFSTGYTHRVSTAPRSHKADFSTTTLSHANQRITPSMPTAHVPCSLFNRDAGADESDNHLDRRTTVASSNILPANQLQPEHLLPATDPENQNRVSEWLGHRSQSSSFSTIKSFSTGSSFADHRHQRSLFYGLSRPAMPPPPPLPLVRSAFHQRTDSSSSASSVTSSISTDIHSLDDEEGEDHDRRSEYSDTTVPEVQSRTGTTKSTASGGDGGGGGGSVVSYDAQGPRLHTPAITTLTTRLKPIISGMPDLPAGYVDAINTINTINTINGGNGKNHPPPITTTVQVTNNGPRTPQVGLAY